MWHLLKFSCGVLVCGCGAVVACVLCRKWENGKNFTTRTFIRELFNLVPGTGILPVPGTGYTGTWYCQNGKKFGRIGKL